MAIEWTGLYANTGYSPANNKTQDDAVTGMQDTLYVTGPGYGAYEAIVRLHNSTGKVVATVNVSGGGGAVSAPPPVRFLDNGTTYSYSLEVVRGFIPTEDADKIIIRLIGGASKRFPSPMSTTPSGDAQFVGAVQCIPRAPSDALVLPSTSFATTYQHIKRVWRDIRPVMRPKVVLDLNDTNKMTSGGSFSWYENINGDKPTFANGEMLIAGKAAAAQFVFGIGQPRPDCFSGMQADLTWGNGATVEKILIGVSRCVSPYNSLFAEFNKVAGTVRVGCTISGGGGSAFNGTVYTNATLVNALTSIGFTLHRNAITAWGKAGATAQWQALCTAELKSWIDCRDTAAMGFENTSTAGYRFFVKSFLDSGSTQKLSNVTFGDAGMIGMADWVWVRNEDGSPVVRDGKMFATGSIRGTAGGTYCGVFSVDPTSYAVEYVGRILVVRGGLTQGDSPIAVMYDRPNSRWVYTISSWGDIGYPGTDNIGLLCGTTKSAPLRGDVVITDPGVVVPFAGDSPYDGDLVVISGIYTLVYRRLATVNSANCYVRRASTLEGLATAEDAPVGVVGEGPKLLKIGGAWYIAGGQRNDGSLQGVWTVDGAYIGNACFPIYKTGVFNLSNGHPTFITSQQGGKTKIVRLAFSEGKYTPQVQQTSGAFPIGNLDTWSYGDTFMAETAWMNGSEYGIDPNA